MSVKVLSKAALSKATGVVADLTQRNPKCVEDYIQVRQTLNELERTRRELEAEVIDYAHIQVMEGGTNTLQLYGDLASEVELQLVSRKPTEKQIVASHPELQEMADQLADDRETTREQNADKINQIIAAMEELSQEIEDFSHSEGGQKLLIEYKKLLKQETKAAGSTYSIRYKELKSKL